MADDIAVLAVKFGVPVDSVSRYADGFRQLAHGEHLRASVEEAFRDIARRLPSRQLAAFRQAICLASRWSPDEVVFDIAICRSCLTSDDVLISPPLPARTVCEKCCPDHDFRHSGERYECTFCGADGGFR